MFMTLNMLRPEQNGRHFAGDIFKRIFLRENLRILVKFSPKFVHRGPPHNITTLVEIMACSLTEPIHYHHQDPRCHMARSQCIDMMSACFLVPITLWSLTHLRPRQNGFHLADDILKLFSRMKIFEFRLQLQWSLFLEIQLTTRSDKRQLIMWTWWPSLLTHI